MGGVYVFATASHALRLPLSNNELEGKSYQSQHSTDSYLR